MNEVEIAIACCSMAAGISPGSSAAMVGRSNACAAPSTATATKIPGVLFLPDAQHDEGDNRRLDDLADQPDPPPVELVGDMPDDEWSAQFEKLMIELAQVSADIRKKS